MHKLRKAICQDSHLLTLEAKEQGQQFKQLSASLKKHSNKYAWAKKIFSNNCL